MHGVDLEFLLDLRYDVVVSIKCIAQGYLAQQKRLSSILLMLTTGVNHETEEERRRLSGRLSSFTPEILSPRPHFIHLSLLTVSASGTNTSTLYVLRPERPQTARAALVHTNVVVITPSSSLHQNHTSITIHESLLEHHPVSTTPPPVSHEGIIEFTSRARIVRSGVYNLPIRGE